MLLLKLVQFFPESTNLVKLLNDTKAIVRELSKLQNCHTVYLSILDKSIQKFEKALVEQGSSNRLAFTGTAFDASCAAALDFETYVPDEFVFEWDFGRLGLFNIPLDFQDLFSNMNSC